MVHPYEAQCASIRLLTHLSFMSTTHTDKRYYEVTPGAANPARRTHVMFVERKPSPSPQPSVTSTSEEQQSAH